MSFRTTITDIDAWRKTHMAVAELIDILRIAPRLILAGYAYIIYEIVHWYMVLEPYMLQGCDVDKLGEVCVIQAPTTAHDIIVTSIIGVATVVAGLYLNSGRKWNGFTPWNGKHQPPKEAGSPPTEE